MEDGTARKLFCQLCRQRRFAAAAAAVQRDEHGPLRVGLQQGGDGLGKR